MGPMGGPWCCWPFLCVLVFVVVASVGISLIQTLVDCSTEYDGNENGPYTVRPTTDPIYFALTLSTVIPQVYIYGM